MYSTPLAKDHIFITAIRDSETPTFPCVHRQFCIVERPVKLLCSNGLVSRIVVRGEIRMSQGFSGGDSFLWIEHEHPFQKVDRMFISSMESLGERNLLALRKICHEAKSLWQGKGKGKRKLKRSMSDDAEK